MIFYLFGDLDSVYVPACEECDRKQDFWEIAFSVKQVFKAAAACIHSYNCFIAIVIFLGTTKNHKHFNDLLLFSEEKPPKPNPGW